MIIRDRVYCDLCEVEVGQLHAGPVQTPGALADQRVPPYFCVCPDCLDDACSESGWLLEITDEDEAFIAASFGPVAA